MGEVELNTVTPIDLQFGDEPKDSNSNSMDLLDRRLFGRFREHSVFKYVSHLQEWLSYGRRDS